MRIKYNKGQFERAVKLFSESPKYMKNAINDTARGAKTDILSKDIGILSELNVKRKIIKDSVDIKFSKISNLEAKLRISGRGIPAYDKSKPWFKRDQKPALHFGGKRNIRPGKTKRKAYTYSFQFKKNKPRVTFKNAFMARMRSGHTGLFVRTGKGRYPIKEIISSSPVDIIQNKSIQGKLLSSISDRFNNNIEKQIKRLT